MQSALMLPPEPTERWTLARQMDVTQAVTKFPDVESGEPWDFEHLLRLRNRFRDSGLEVAVMEDRPPVDDAILGREGRDEQIAIVQEMLRNLGRVGIDVWCWVWMAPLKVLRTSESVRSRGDSLVTEYQHDEMERGPRMEEAVPEAELWENLEYFLDRVVPVAEEAGVKLALHPDDPPLSPVRGQDRIVTSIENYERILSLHESDYHGLTFCQGNFAAMGADVPEAIRQFGDQIHFAHFRDVEGTADSFVETWHDAGPTDMVAAMQAYDDIDFEGVIRPDHVPTMAGESGYRAGYATKGRLWAIGYMQGLQEAVQGRYPSEHSS